MNAQTGTPILELHHVGKSFAKPSGEPLPVLSDIDISLADGEILGLLGRSGSGKSTLLRIAGGLVKPTSGEVLYRGRPLDGPSSGVAVVFQSFALYPWLTVLDNVELGLDSLRLAPEEAHARARAAIELISLDGFEAAYPRELSGGMRQRVGFARALVAEPVLLLMDEPFSALDVLTAESLRTEFLDLWTEKRLSTRAALIVTHNIEEAVLMCDRILVLGANPGHIMAEIPVSLPQPRNRFDAAFHAVVDEIYAILTAHVIDALDGQGKRSGGLTRQLPAASVNRVNGFIETLATEPYKGHADLGQIARPLALTSSDLLPIAAALHLLELAELKDGALKLTAAGRLFAESGAPERKWLFREHLVRFVPLAAHVRQVLEEREDHQAPRARFEYELEDHMSRSDAQATLRTLIDWSRYAELFSYDDQSRKFALPASSAEAGSAVRSRESSQTGD